MSEKSQLPIDNDRTRDELLKGVELGPTERVVFDGESETLRGIAEYASAHEWGKDATFEVAELKLGARDHTYTAATIRFYGPDYFRPNPDNPTGTGKSLVIPTKDGSVVIDLENGVMHEIGRGVKGLENMAETVSRDHCSIGLDELGNVVIENHEPSNATRVQLLTGLEK